MNEEDLNDLYERVKELKTRELFEEPCPLYEEEEDE